MSSRQYSGIKRGATTHPPVLLSIGAITDLNVVGERSQLPLLYRTSDEYHGAVSAGGWIAHG